MTPNRWAFTAAIAALLVSCLLGAGWAWNWYDHQVPPEQHLNQLHPAPADHDWITPSQPEATP